MNNVIHRIAGLIMTAAMILGNTVDTRAAGNIYYVSTTGTDTNPGTASAPFKTFAKAYSVLEPGSTLYVYAGIYNQQLRLTRSGVSGADITIQGLNGKVIIDMQNAAAPGLDVRASFVTIGNLEVRRSNDVCVNLTGSNITVNGLVVHDCASHGIQANSSSNVNILNNGIYRTALANASRTLASGWGSGIKVRVSDNVLIQGNIIYNNYGEGIGTRGTNITIRANTVYDNYSVNIYTNSENAVIERNFVYCTPNSGFERNGAPAAGIAMGEEYFEGWGARLVNARVINNIVAFCRHGVRYNGAEAGVVGGGLKNAVIVHNTLYGSTNATISIAYASAQSGSLIANNIIWQAQNNLSAIDNPIGLTFQNNMWKVLPPAPLRSPGDIIGDPQLTADPVYQPASYRPTSTSVTGAGIDVGVTSDFFALQRGPTLDLGAIEVENNTVMSGAQEAASPTVTPVQLTATLPPGTAQASVSPTLPTVNPTITAPSSTSTLAAPTITPSSLPPTATFTSVPTQPAPTLTSQPTQTAQETQYDNKHSAFVYSAGWVEELKDYAIGDSFARTSTNGSSVTFQFTGQSLSIIYKGGPSYRKMEVFIDGVLVATIDQRHDVSTYKARWDFPGKLSTGEHTLKLVFVTTSSRTNGSVDAVIVR